MGDQRALKWTKPRVKPEHEPFRIGGNRIRIGGPVYGTASEIADPSGTIWTLLQNLDGSRSVAEIVTEVVAEHPARSAEDVRGVFDQLAAAGFVEDLGAPDPPELTERDKERYDRSRQFYRWTDLTPRAGRWEPQVSLRNARVVVVGLGGTGGSAVLALAASGVGSLHCVDDDVVELSNLNRQILYSEKDIGRPKVDAAVERLRGLNSDITVTAQRLRVNGPDDFAPLVRDCDVLLLAADQPGDIRAWANRACLAGGTPWVDSGYHGPRASVCAYVPWQGPCYECHWLAEHDRTRALGTRRDYRTARGGAHAVSATSAGLSGQLAAHSAIALITGASPVEPGRLHGVNLIAPDDQYLVDDPRRPDCPACGSRP